MAPRTEGMTLAQAVALLHPADVAGLHRALRRALRHRRADVIVRCAGRRVLLRCTLAHDDGGHVRTIDVLALDISEAFEAAQRSSELQQRLARAAAALTEANERAALAVRAAGMGTWEQDLQTLTVYWDEQMFRLRGLEPEGPLAPIGRGRELVHVDDRDGVLQAWQESMRTGEPVSA